MLATSGIAEIGALVGDPGRSNMLVALLDGRALTAKELAARAGITQQTASVHIAKLLTAGLIVMERRGSHHYHRICSVEVARMLESIMCVAAINDALRDPSERTSTNDAALRLARCCYDHLAGKLAVAIAESLLMRGFVVFAADDGEVTPAGEAFFREFDIPLEEASPRPTGLCRPCMDWSERKPHLAGALGTALMNQFFIRRWIRRLEGTRAVGINPAGQKGFRQVFGV